VLKVRPKQGRTSLDAPMERHAGEKTAANRFGLETGVRDECSHRPDCSTDDTEQLV